MQWLAIVIEVIGLSLIAIELYLPGPAKRLKTIFEATRLRATNRSDRSGWYGSVLGIGLYVMIWILVVTMLSIWDPSMSIVANLAFTILTIFIFVLIGISRLLVRAGVVLGRGNSVGGVGLVAALIGFSLEVSQLVLPV